MRNARTLARRVGLIVPALVLSACQIPVPQPVQPPHLLPDQGVSVDGVTTNQNQAVSRSTETFTIKRDTLRDSLTLSGRVVPGRSTQLTFKGSGTVNAIYVTPG